MATEYKDGTFSETLPISEAMEKFMEAVDSNTAKSFHVGTPAQIESIKSESCMKERLSEIESKLKQIESEKRGVVHIPTFQEIRSICGKSVDKD